MVAEMDPHKPGHMSVTLKQDGKDGTWIVFHGTAKDIRSQIVATFDMEGQDEAPLYDLINEATRTYKATGNLNSALGGRVIKKDGASASDKGGSAWDRATGAGAPQEEPVDLNVVRLTKAIEDATDVPTLHNLYARDKAHFEANAELFALWQAKGKSLSAS